MTEGDHSLVAFRILVGCSELPKQKVEQKKRAKSETICQSNSVSFRLFVIGKQNVSKGKRC